MDIDDSSIKLLAELAFIAGERSMNDQTDQLVAALTVLRPTSERPYLIQALAKLAQGHAQDAERIVREQALNTNPNSALAQAYLGLILHQQGRAHERDHVLQAALAAQDSDADAAQLAQHLLTTPVG